MLPGMKHLIEICSSNRIGQTIVRPARLGSVITRFIGNIDQPKPMGVRIDGGGFTTYEAARLAGSRALADFLEQVELESFRPD
jgi:hypothetical protein